MYQWIFIKFACCGRKTNFQNHIKRMPVDMSLEDHFGQSVPICFDFNQPKKIKKLKATDRKNKFPLNYCNVLKSKVRNYIRSHNIARNYHPTHTVNLNTISLIYTKYRLLNEHLYRFALNRIGFHWINKQILN